MFSPSCVKLLHLQSKNTQIKTNKMIRLKYCLKKNKHNYIISQPEPERRFFAVGSWAGYPVFLFVLCFSRSLSVVLLFLSVVFVLSSPSLFKLFAFTI